MELVPEQKRKDIKDMMLRMVIGSADGDKVRINVPMALIQVAIDTGTNLFEVSGNDAIKKIDWTQILNLVRQGVIGNLLEIEAEDTVIRIFVE